MLIKKKQKEILVGGLLLLVLVLIGVFAYLIGHFRPFQNAIKYRVMYHFAGGVEVGAPIRVAGVKVGKIDQIDFMPIEKSKEPLWAPIRVTVSVNRNVKEHVREDSQFFINMAGIIGEKYIEITPGSPDLPALNNEAVVLGVTPPRIDQLLSQGYGFFGELKEIVTTNEKDFKQFIQSLPKSLNHVSQLVQLIKKEDWHRLMRLIKGMNSLTEDLKSASQELKEAHVSETVNKLFDLIKRVHTVDEEKLKEFLQEEGIRARIF